MINEKITKDSKVSDVFDCVASSWFDGAYDVNDSHPIVTDDQTIGLIRSNVSPTEYETSYNKYNSISNQITNESQKLIDNAIQNIGYKQYTSDDTLGTLGRTLGEKLTEDYSQKHLRDYLYEYTSPKQYTQAYNLRNKIKDNENILNKLGFKNMSGKQAEYYVNLYQNDPIKNKKIKDLTQSDYDEIRKLTR